MNRSKIQSLRLVPFDASLAPRTGVRKISKDLREMMRYHGEGAECEVLVVLDTPQSDLSAFMAPNIDWTQAEAKRPNQDSIEKIRRTVEAKLFDLGESGSRWVNSSHAFLVELGAREMKVLAEMPEVLEIVPNARLA